MPRTCQGKQPGSGFSDCKLDVCSKEVAWVCVLRIWIFEQSCFARKSIIYSENVYWSGLMFNKVIIVVCIKHLSV